MTPPNAPAPVALSRPEPSHGLRVCSGWARRVLALIAGMLCWAATVSAQAQTALGNGFDASGELSPAGDVETYSLTAPAGAGIMLRAGAGGLTPKLRVYDGVNALIAENVPGNTLSRDGFLNLTATNGGNYTVQVSAAYGTQTGTFTLRSAVAASDFSTDPADEGGPLGNGVLVAATLALGDLDLWGFTAAAGDGLMLRVGSTNFTPWLRLYGPTGALVEETISGNALVRDGFLTLTATNAGNYLLVVSAAYAGQSGTYAAHLARTPGEFSTAPGDEGGGLVNGAAYPGLLPRGDLDLWEFDAVAGSGVMVRVGATGFTPWIRLYRPDGALAAETISGNALVRDGFLTVAATNAGTYRVVVSAAYAGQEGSYGLHLTQAPGLVLTSPGDEGGVLTNGVSTSANLELGDLDAWTFTAEAGQGLMVRMGGTGLTPWLRLYGPTGALVDETTSGNALARDGVLTLQTTNAGNYLLVASAAYAGQSGPYTLNRILVPSPFTVGDGDGGGGLINGFTNTASLALGDLDVWSFIGTPGDSNALRVAATGFTPWLRLYGPTGSLVGETISGNTLVRSGVLPFPVTNAGLYTLVIAASYGGQSGTYTFKQSRFPPDLIVPADVQLDEGATLNVPLSAHDPDEPNKPLQFALLNGPPGATLAIAGLTNAMVSWPTSEADGPSTNLFVATVTDVVNGRAFTRTNSFAVVVRELNLPPTLTVPGPQTVDEGAAFAAVAAATDSDLPVNGLAFSLAGAPAGLTIHPTTGALAWNTSEADGPASHVVTVVVTDDNPWAVDVNQWSVTNTFTLVINEVNRPPELAPQADRVIVEGTPLVVPQVATDPDLPANVLSWTLLAPPAGAAISANGVIAWTPSEQQGSSTNEIVTVVRDNGTPSLSATNRFVVVVTEINTAPILTLPADATIAELTPWTAAATATDSDLPANPLTFSLLSTVDGLTLDASTGALRWTPTEAQGPSTNLITVVLADANPAALSSPVLRVTNSFRLVVTEQNLAPALAAIEDVSLHFDVPLTVAATATDADLPANRLRYALDQAPAGMAIDVTTGLITWTPSSSQVGSHPVTVTVTDDGSPGLSASQQFSVTVTGEGVSLAINRLAGTLTQISASGDAGANYELQSSSDLGSWEKLVEFQMGGTPYLYIDPASATIPVRFYRLLLRQ